MNILDLFSFVGVFTIFVGAILVLTICCVTIRYSFKQCIEIWKDRNYHQRAAYLLRQVRELQRNSKDDIIQAICLDLIRFLEPTSNEAFWASKHYATKK